MDSTARARLVELAGRLRPWLVADAVRALEDALARTRTNSLRVLVIGEAKRGKSTLVNALFGRDLLPTGVLPLTSVATVVTTSPTHSAQARYLDGRTEPISLAEVAGLVSERGNPSNIKEIDQVRITAPTALLPVGVDVVDTPGTGSIHRANTAEAGRAASTVDIAVLVVSADPPVSAAELSLISDAMATASAAVLVVNKTDLVRSEDVDEIVTFTRQAVTTAIGAQLPVIPMSLRATTQRSVAALAQWLRARIAEHGARDVLASTSRAWRRHARSTLDGLRVTQTLLRRNDQDSATTVAALRTILDTARQASTTARDHITSQARRARVELDHQYEQETAAALRAARDLLTSPSPADLPGGAESTSPEAQTAALREQLQSRAAQHCQTWFDHIAAEVNTMLLAAAEQAIADLDQRLATARQAAEHVLHLRLAEATRPAPRQPPARPRLALGEPVAWQELVTATIARHLPASVRRRRLHAHLREWAESAVPRPFGRARASVQDWLGEATRQMEAAVSDLWRDRLAMLERGLDSALAHRQATHTELAEQLRAVSERITTVEQAVSGLDQLLAEVTDTGDRRSTVC